MSNFRYPIDLRNIQMLEVANQSTNCKSNQIEFQPKVSIKQSERIDSVVLGNLNFTVRHRGKVVQRTTDKTRCQREQLAQRRAYQS